MTGRVHTIVDGSIGWLIFDNPQRRNSMTYEMWRSVAGLCSDLDSNPAVRVVVLRGAGEKAFVAGADITEFLLMRKGSSAGSYDQATSDAYRAVANISKPTLAMVSGFCIGGGLGLALSADIRYCSTVSRFALPPARLGIGYEAEGLARLVALIGPAAAKEMVYTADLLEADEAKGLGLVSRVYAQTDLEPSVIEIAKRIAERAPLSQRAAKLAIDDYVAGQPNGEAVARAIEDCANSADYSEGVNAFLEKREPVFRGV